MNINLRAGKPDDAATCGTICYEAFNRIADQHNFPHDFPNSEAAIGLLTELLSRGDIYSVVAEVDDRVVGSNFLWESAAVAGVGPITVDPNVQNVAVGRQLMERVMRRAKDCSFAGVRLVQAAYHNRSLSLYTKLGFDTREPLSTIQGPAVGLTVQGYDVRPAKESDLSSCNKLSFKVHGLERGAELLEAIKQGTATVVEHDGRITGYASLVGFFGHAVLPSGPVMLTGLRLEVSPQLAITALAPPARLALRLPARPSAVLRLREQPPAASRTRPRGGARRRCRWRFGIAPSSGLPVNKTDAPRRRRFSRRQQDTCRPP